MLFVCHPKIVHKHCLQFLVGVKMAPRETENNAYAKFWVTNKEHYGILWYFLEWSILCVCGGVCLFVFFFCFVFFSLPLFSHFNDKVIVRVVVTLISACSLGSFDIPSSLIYTVLYLRITS